MHLLPHQPYKYRSKSEIHLEITDLDSWLANSVKQNLTGPFFKANFSQCKTILLSLQKNL